MTTLPQRGSSSWSWCIATGLFIVATYPHLSANVEAVRILKAVGPRLRLGTPLCSKQTQVSYQQAVSRGDGDVQSCNVSTLRGQASLLSGEVVAGRDLLAAVERRCRLSQTALLFLGIAYDRSGMHEAALGVFRSIGPEAFFLNSARAWRAAARCDEAVEAGVMGARLVPESADMHEALAEALISCSDAGGAVQSAQALIRLEPGSERSHYWAGYLAERRGDLQGAEAEWTKALERSPASYRNLMSMGDLLLNSGRASEAAPYYERARQAGPDRPEALYGLGRVALQSGGPNEAVTHFSAAAVLGPREPGYLMYLARSFAASGKISDAQRAYRSAASLAAGREDLRWYELEEGQFLEQVGAFSEAANLYAAIQARFPGSSAASEARRRETQLKGGRDGR